MSQPLWLYLHFPRLALETLWAPSEQPLALVDQQQQLVQLNRQSERVGLTPDMGLATAYCLCPSLQVEQYQPQREQQALEQLALRAYQLAAQVYLRPPRGLLLEVASMLRWHGGLPALWQQCQQLFQPLGLSLQPALAYTPLQAQLLAVHRRGRSRLEPAWIKKQINRLPLQVTGLPEQQQRRLQRMGIRRIGQLQQLPKAALGYRMGQEILQWLAQLERCDTGKLVPFEPPQRFEHTLDFLYEVENSESLLFPLKRLLSLLEDYLNSRQLSVSKIMLKLYHRKHAASRWWLSSLQPQHQQEHFLQLARILCEQRQLESPVIALGLRCTRFYPRDLQASDLFQHSTHHHHGLLDLLQTRLGSEAVWSPAVRDDPRPEFAWSKQPAGEGAGGHRIPPRPLWLLPQPQEVNPGHYPQLNEWERITGGWWQGQAVRRDYVLASHRNGTHHWLFRRDDGSWFLHGILG